MLLGVSLVAYVAWRLFARPERGDLGIKYLPYLLVSFGLLLLHNFTHYLLFASHYRPYVEYLIETSYLSTLLEASGAIQIVIAVLAVLAILGAVMVLLRRIERGDRRRAGGLALVALLVAYALNYGATTAGRLDDTTAWLSWYLSWPLLAAGAAALVWLIAGRASRDAGATLVVAVLVVVGLQHLWNPLEPSVHIWAMRRFVPVVLPLLMLTVSMGVAAGLDRVASMFRGWAAVVAGLCSSWRSWRGRRWRWRASRSGGVRSRSWKSSRTGFRPTRSSSRARPWREPTCRRRWPISTTSTPSSCSIRPRSPGSWNRPSRAGWPAAGPSSLPTPARRSPCGSLLRP